jgi:hypothetical protein
MPRWRRKSASRRQRVPAPHLLGATEAKKPVEADERFEKLKPFQERVAEDIRDGNEDG